MKCAQQIKILILFGFFIFFFSPSHGIAQIVGNPDVDDDGDRMTENQGDCDDSRVDTYGGAVEICDGRDNNCDGQTDNNLNGFSPYCENKMVCVNGACQPCANQPEICDGTDNNCNRQIDEGNICPQGQICDQRQCKQEDADGDGHNLFIDCNDNNPAINSAQTDVCDGVDNNCDGQIDNNVVCPDGQLCFENRCQNENEINIVDADHDGSNNLEDCNDNNASVKPGLAEICDGSDNNCDTIVDNGNPCEAGQVCVAGACMVDDDRDGYPPGPQDCNDNDPRVSVSHAEFCDGMDNNCNDQVDEGAFCPEDSSCLAGRCQRIECEAYDRVVPENLRPAWLAAGNLTTCQDSLDLSDANIRQNADRFCTAEFGSAESPSACGSNGHCLTVADRRCEADNDCAWLREQYGFSNLIQADCNEATQVCVCQGEGCGQCTNYECVLTSDISSTHRARMDAVEALRCNRLIDFNDANRVLQADRWCTEQFGGPNDPRYCSRHGDCKKVNQRRCSEDADCTRLRVDWNYEGVADKCELANLICACAGDGCARCDWVAIPGEALNREIADNNANGGGAGGCNLQKHE